MNSIPELGILNLALCPERETVYRNDLSRSVQAALLKHVSMTSPGMARLLHDVSVDASETVHAWTIAPLRGQFVRKGQRHFVSPDIRYHIRIAVLDSDVAGVLDRALSFRNQTINLDGAKFRILPEESWWDELTTYPMLHDIAEMYSRVKLEFTSPVGFRTSSKVPAIPDPLLCARGYLRKWNAFSVIPFNEEPLLEFVEKRVITEECSLRLVTHHLGTYVQKGYTGTVRWKINKSSPELHRQAVTLFHYARYCGTGMKTALGMGQTRILE